MAKYLFILAMALYAAPAMAGGVVATPALAPPAGGFLACTVANASDKKPIEVEWGVYDFNGDAVYGPTIETLGPLESTGSTGVVTQATCVAKVLKGGNKSLRLALYAADSSLSVVAVVSGY